MALETLLSFSSSFIGSITILIILSRNNNKASCFLALFLFTLVYGNFIIFLFESGYILKFSHLYRTAPIAIYLKAPAIYLSILFISSTQSKLRWFHALHLLPTLLYIVDYIPLLVSSADHKLAIIQSLLKNKTQIISFREGWLFPSGTHTPLKNIIALLYMIPIAKIYLQVRKNALTQEQKQKAGLNWIMFLAIVFFVNTLLGFLIEYYSAHLISWKGLFIQSMFLTLVICCMFLFTPRILYGIHLWRYQQENNEPPPPLEEKQVTLKAEVISELHSKIDAFIKNKGYLNNNIKMIDVANELNIQPHILSAYLNQIHKIRFNDFINQLRVEYVKKCISNGQWNLLTLEAIAEKAGFNNRTTFLNAFKKFSGTTPANFLRKIREDKNIKFMEK